MKSIGSITSIFLSTVDKTLLFLNIPFLSAHSFYNTFTSHGDQV